MAFPTGPTDGQVHTENRVEYTYEAATNRWLISGSDAGVTVGSTEPSNPIEGDIWVDDTDSNKLVWHIYDGTDFKELKAGAELHKQNSKPTSGDTGDIWIDNTDASRLVWHIHDGTDYVELKAGMKVSHQNSGPSNPELGDVWLDGGGGTNVPTALMYDGSAWFNLGIGYKRASGDPPSWSSARYGDVYTDSSTGITYIAGHSHWNPMTSHNVELWETLSKFSQNLTNGYIVNIRPDWNKTLMIRFYVATESQSVLLGTPSNAGRGMFNFMKHDGTPFQKNLDLSGHRLLNGRCQFYAWGWLVKEHNSTDWWVGWLEGITQNNQNGFGSPDGDWWDFRGSLRVQGGILFGSYSGEAGKLMIRAEQLRS